MQTDYSRFYTSPQIADILIRQIEVPHPPVVIDICCGSCNLLYSAKKRWQNAQLVGVDIIEHSSDGVKRVCEDGRKYAIENKGKYPLVLANPPFYYLQKKREFPELFFEWMDEYHTSRLENEMLLANLRLLDKSGTLMIIMPSTFVEADVNKKLRVMLANRYHIHKIIRLPEEAFGSANIKTYAIIVRKVNSKKKYTRYYSINTVKGNLLISKSIILPQRTIRSGKWDIHEEEKINHFLNMKRGNISSQLFEDGGIPVLHTSKKQENWKPSIRYISKMPQRPVYAEQGDILVSRIGKSAGQWCVYQGNKTIITDCLYRIKDPEGSIIKRLKDMEYSYIIRGVATRYITVKDFTLWYQSL